MPRRKHMKKKRRNHHKSKNKQNKSIKKPNINRSLTQHKSNAKMASFLKDILGDTFLKDIFDVEQTDDDLKHVAKLQEDLYNDLDVNSDLNDEQKNAQFSQLFAQQFKYYYFHENIPLLKEINAKIPTLHNKYGRGAFVSSFAKASDVKKMKFDIFIKNEYSCFIECKSQILANGALIWLPLDKLNMIFPPTSDAYAAQRNNYAINGFYYNVTLFYVDCPYNLNYIVLESVTSNDILHREYHQKIERYIFNEKGSRYSVKQFVRKFPELKSLLKPFSDDKYVRQAQQNSFLQCLNENRFKMLLDSAEPVSTKEFVKKIRDEIIPKSMIIAFLDDSDDIDDSAKSEITSSLEYIYGEEMENILTQKCQHIYRSRQEMREANKCSFAYRSEFEDQLWCVITIQKEIFEKICSIDQLLKKFIYTGEYFDCFKKHIQEHPKKNQIVNSVFNWENFSTKLVGRKCANCSKQENRFDDKNERFSKCSSCQSVFYCQSKCQKMHWNKQHRNECKNMRNMKQFIENL